MVNILMARNLRLKFTAVDYPGPSHITTAVIRNDVQYTVNIPSAVKAQLDAGQFKVVGSLSESRHPDFPEAPSLRESGYTGYMPTIWNGLFTSADTPANLTEAIADSVRAVVNDDEFRTSLEGMISGKLQRDSSPAKFRQQLSEESKAWLEVFTTTKAP